MAIEINLNDVASATDLSSHELDVNNPHAVTKTQVGLSDADNTSDVNKPISSATQTALNGKEDLSNKQTDLTPSATNYPTVNAVNTGLSGKLNDIEIDSTPTSSSTNLVTSGGVFTGLNNYGITVDLIDALTVDFALGYSYIINSVTNVTNAPTTTILDDGVAYVLGATIATNSVMTVTVSTAARVQLNVTRL